MAVNPTAGIFPPSLFSAVLADRKTSRPVNVVVTLAIDGRVDELEVLKDAIKWVKLDAENHVLSGESRNESYYSR